MLPTKLAVKNKNSDEQLILFSSTAASFSTCALVLAETATFFCHLMFLGWFSAVLWALC